MDAKNLLLQSNFTIFTYRVTFGNFEWIHKYINHIKGFSRHGNTLPLNIGPFVKCSNTNQSQQPTASDAHSGTCTVLIRVVRVKFCVGGIYLSCPPSAQGFRQSTAKLHPEVYTNLVIIRRTIHSTLGHQLKISHSNPRTSRLPKTPIDTDAGKGQYTGPGGP